MCKISGWNTLKCDLYKKRHMHGLRGWIVSCVKKSHICLFCTPLISIYFVLKIYTLVHRVSMCMCTCFSFFKCASLNFDHFIFGLHGGQASSKSYFRNIVIYFVMVLLGTVNADTKMLFYRIPGTGFSARNFYTVRISHAWILI